MKEVFIIKAKMTIEYNNYKFENWDKVGKNIYGFKTLEEAQKEIYKLRNEEVRQYSEWLKTKNKCFIHKIYEIENILIFEND